jgi:hypothetical protein
MSTKYAFYSMHDFVFLFSVLTNSAYHTHIKECGTLAEAGHRIDADKETSGSGLQIHNNKTVQRHSSPRPP